MTLMQMIEQGAYLHIAGMGALFIAWFIMLGNIGSAGKPAAQNNVVQGGAGGSHKGATNPAVTAAISAAVNEYRKTN
ncbi:MAG: sodium pump decarboxylase subunit gamma [Treponema sp.]|nr:sodium pump decarboxylase subunit gamma [Treponema sp.]MCL2237913.1 sodium pump decarboxylase subunit gamma [Treponema sp.]